MGRMRNANKIEVNVEWLRMELEKRGVTLAKASTEIGHSVAFLSKSLTNDGSLRMSDILALQSLYGISAQSAMKRQEAELEPEPKPTFDWDRLAQVIEDAVYKALNR